MKIFKDYGDRLGIILALIVLGFVLYGEILFYNLTMAETPYILLSAKVESLSDLKNILTSTFMGRSGLGYFRPVTTLIFSLNYPIWGLNPLGYHLFNLLSHLGVGLLMFTFVERFEGDVFTAGLAAALFLLFPTHQQVLPAINMGQDVYVALFFMLTLVCFFTFLRGERDFFSISYFSSLLFFGFTLGAKESGVLLFPILASLWWMQTPYEISKPNLKRFLQCLAPFLLLGTMYFCYWGWVTDMTPVLEGGGPWRPPILRSSVTRTLRQYYDGLTWQGLLYTSTLLYPLEHVLEASGVSTFTLPMEASLTKFLTILTVFSGALFLALDWPGLAQARSRDEVVLTGRGSTLTKYGLIAACSGGILLGLWPLYSPLLDRFVESAFPDLNRAPLIWMLEQGQPIHLTQYQEHIRELTFVSGLLFVLSSCLFLAFLHTTSRFYSKQNSFYVFWLLLPFLFFGVADIFHVRNAYIGLPAFCVLVAKLTVPLLTKPGFSGQLPGLHSGREKSAAYPVFLGLCVLGAIFSLSIVYTSPLFHQSFSEWNTLQKNNGRLIQTLETALRRLPPDSQVKIVRSPNWDTDRSPKYPNFAGRGRAVPRLVPWIRLRFPDKNFTVEKTRNYYWLKMNREYDFTIRRTIQASHAFTVNIEVKNGI